MGVSRLWCRAEYRGRWLQHLTVALLIGLVGAAALTCLAAARRTDSTYARYLRTQAIPDAEVSLPDGNGPERVGPQIRELDGVAAAGGYDALFAGPDRPDVIPGQDFIVFIPLDDEYGRTVDRLIVLDGRMPAADAADEVIVNERAVREFGLTVGSKIKVRSIGANEAEAMGRGDFGAITFAGPRPTLRVVGVGRARVDLTGNTYVNQYAFATPAFTKQYGTAIFRYGAQFDVRYRATANRQATTRAIADITNTDVRQLDESSAALRDTARIQAIALLLIGLTALLAGAFVVSQSIGRMVRSSRAELIGLRHLGVDRATSVRAAMFAFLPSSVAGTVLAVLGAWIGSRWFPTGLVGRAEVDRGMQVDGTVFALGAAMIVVMVGARVAIGAARAARPKEPHRVAKVSWVDRVAAELSPAGMTGVRWAVGGAEGKRPLAGAVAAIVGVAGLLAVTTYTDQLEHVVTTPAAYGDPSDAAIEAGDDPEVLTQLRDVLLAQATIGDLTSFTLASRLSVNRAAMQAWAFEDIRGHIEPTVVRGRAPTRDNEALVGTKSAEHLRVGIGDHVRVVGTSNDEHELTVVGTGLFPNGDTDAIASGIVTTKRTFDALRPRDARLGVAFRWKHGTDVAAAIKQLSKLDIEIAPAAPPPDIVNMRVVKIYPWWLAGFLAVLGIFATTNTLVVSSRRRRREIAVLGAIGFSRRQLTEARTIQGVTVGLLAAIVGIPAGLLIGKWLWTAHADRIGLSTALGLPLHAAFAVGAATIALTSLIAVAAGRSAMRAPLATALRTE